tara:strand:- start:561 stop:1925 length:1365 start_codon:yes stop_codon:yes gene_type:complete
MATSIKRSKGSQSSLRIGTYSYWIRIATANDVSGGFQVYSNTVENDNNRGYWQYTSDHKWRMVDNDASGTHIQLRTNRLFKDLAGWYHFVIRIDTTQSTSTDRVRLYVNGVQETSFDQTDYPSQNTDLKIFEGGQTNREYMNRIYGGSPQSANWYVSHFHYCDGQSYGPDTFGSTDATTGEWKINTSPSVTYGNQGWFMFKNDASLNDDSGNGNNWSADSGTIQKSEDCPSNVFATWNEFSRVNNYSQRYVEHLEGSNTAKGTSNANNGNSYSTLGANSGKFYCEIKATDVQSNAYPNIGFMSEPGAVRTSGGSGQITTAGGTTYNPNGDLILDASVTSSWGATYTDNDIIQLAMDLDNGAFYFGKNGTWQNSGNPASGGSKTGAARSFTPDGTFYFFGTANYTTSCEVKANFGNGFFGTTAVSSAGTNASNNGIFEYDVPSGYTALSTKGLNL